jgi:hypothetical protein
MAYITLHTKVQEELYNQFRRAVTDKSGKWRGSKQSPQKAFQTAIEAALLLFLDSLEEKINGDRFKP